LKKAFKYRRNHFYKDDEITVVPINQQTDIPMHNHDCHELVIVLSGEGNHITEEETYRIFSGDVFIIPPGKLHCYSETENLNLVNIMFWSNRIPMPYADMLELPGYHALFALEPKLRYKQSFKTRLTLKPDELQIISALIKNIESELKEKQKGYRSMTIMHFFHLICEISRFYSSNQSKATQSLMRIGQLLSHLESHYHQQITIDDMAKISHLSLSSLNRIFLKTQGVSPVKYLLLLRLKKARVMLDNTLKQVTEIAYNSGFNDSNYFTRQFKKIYHCSPREYRNKKIS
jgi:AraC-like DNA-binding protein